MSLDQLAHDLLLDSIDLGPHRKVVIELFFHKFLRWELHEHSVKEVDQAIDTIADFNDSIRAEVPIVVLSLSPHKLLDGDLLSLFVFTFKILKVEFLSGLNMVLRRAALLMTTLMSRGNIKLLTILISRGRNQMRLSQCWRGHFNIVIHRVL